MSQRLTKLRQSKLTHALSLGALSALLVAGPMAGNVLAHPATATTTTLRIWYGSDDPTEQAWAEKLSAQFATQHPSIKVQFSFYSLDDMNDKTQLALNTANPPDLIYSPPRGPGLPAYVRVGRLRDLSADAHRLGWATQLRPGLLASYNNLLDANGSASDAGHIYGVPYLMAADALLYNKDIFSRLHLRVPRTEAQLAALLPRLKQAGYVPLGLGNQDAWTGDAWYIALLNAQVGPAALQPALRLAPSFSFTAAAFQQAAATLQSWVKAGYFTPRFGGMDPQDAVEDFFDEGKTAMQLVSSTEASQILSSWRDDDSKATHIGIFAFPADRSGQEPVMVQDGYSGWAVPAASRNPAAAVTYIDAMLSQATTQVLLEQGLIPAHRLSASAVPAAPFQQEFLQELATARPGVFVDAAPIANFLATMEAQIEQLLAGKESPAIMTRTLQQVYATHGRNAPFTDTDGEF